MEFSITSGEVPRHGKYNHPRHVHFVRSEERRAKGMLVEIFLEAQADGSTVVKVSEHAAENNEKGIAWVIGQTEGWPNFLAYMKAWLDHGIRLREGAFDFMKQ